MKRITNTLLALALIACNNKQPKTSTAQQTETARIDSLYLDTNHTNGSGGRPYQEYRHCNFDRFITDPKTPPLAVNIMLNRKWNLNNTDETLALLDSLTAINKASRPFYMKVVTKSYNNADGYYSEGLGLAGKTYVEKHTQEFAENFDHKDCFTDEDLNTWTDIVLLEFTLEQDNIETTQKEHLIHAYCRKLNKQSENYPTTQKETVLTFTKQLTTKWANFLKQH